MTSLTTTTRGIVLALGLAVTAAIALPTQAAHAATRSSLT